jgi:hypothetical protein
VGAFGFIEMDTAADNNAIVAGIAHGAESLMRINRPSSQSLFLLNLWHSPAMPPRVGARGRLFFGRGYGALIYRVLGKNIHWQEIVSERMIDIAAGLQRLKNQGWRFSSVTLDGRKGAISLVEKIFPGVPIQMCLFHQKAIIRRYLTGNPKTECGVAIKNLVADIMTVSEKTFRQNVQTIQATFHNFLKEHNERKQFKHRKLRSALRSLHTNLPYLFAHQRFPERSIPTTTNSCDGSFAHWKAKIKIHRGLRHHRRVKMIHFLLSNS